MINNVKATVVSITDILENEARKDKYYPDVTHNSLRNHQSGLNDDFSYTNTVKNCSQRKATFSFSSTQNSTSDEFTPGSQMQSSQLTEINSRSKKISTNRNSHPNKYSTLYQNLTQSQEEKADQIPISIDKVNLEFIELKKLTKKIELLETIADKHMVVVSQLSNEIVTLRKQVEETKSQGDKQSKVILTELECLKAETNGFNEKLDKLLKLIPSVKGHQQDDGNLLTDSVLGPAQMFGLSTAESLVATAKEKSRRKRKFSLGK